ncbi:hypothetical protein BE04_47440 [Sorangium cellulosum]|uniref:Uncharacterized protein n=1 Tax=Sorangium cellulosum TaxID=56 RepID=A0A150P1D9_SORCE|nr:hypothetical protein BE04_47440 [Sorangium cellulosum]
MELLDARELRVGGLVDVVIQQELERRLELIDDEPGALSGIGDRGIDDEEQPRLRLLHGVDDGEQILAGRRGQPVLDPLEAGAIAVGLPVLLHERRGGDRLAHGDVVRHLQRVVGPPRLGGGLDPAIVVLSLLCHGDCLFPPPASAPLRRGAKRQG